MLIRFLNQKEIFMGINEFMEGFILVIIFNKKIKMKNMENLILLSEYYYSYFINSGMTLILLYRLL
jgi:hypothetical protein